MLVIADGFRNALDILYVWCFFVWKGGRWFYIKFLGKSDGKLIGVIISGHDGRRGFIYHTTVKKEYRGQGIGKKLVGSAMKALEAEGIHKVALVAFEKNVSGNAFWEKVGLI